MKKTTIIGITTVITGLTACFLNPFFSLAQSTPAPSTVGVLLTPGTLSITHIPSSFTMTPVNIDSPVTEYYSYYTNPETEEERLTVNDNRFDGGFTLDAQVNGDYSSGSDSIIKTGLGIKTQNSQISETLKGTTPATRLPAESDYVSFSDTPIVIIDASVDCNMGRVGEYAVYPSFRLQIPNDTPAGNYSTNITYTLIDNPSSPPPC
jgi:hypothetical protein